MTADYKANSITLRGAVAMGTGVMIGAGIFALTGQIAELAGPWYPVSFIAGAIVTAFSAYTYVKMSNAYPSSGGIAMILQKAYGAGAIAAAAALLMAFSMVINQSLVARTFGTYALRPFGADRDRLLVPALAVALIVFAYLVNKAGNRSVGLFSLVMAAIKIGGIVFFGIAALWAARFAFEPAAEPGDSFPLTGFIASVALSILAFKGFTTITNSGAEIVDPHHNVGRTIMISIAICVVIYLLVAFAVGASLSLDQIVAAKDYALAPAAAPAFWTSGECFCGFAHAGDADRHEDDPAQPFRHVRSDPRTHPRLHRSAGVFPCGIFRPQSHRIPRCILLSHHGHSDPLGRLLSSTARHRCTGVGAYHGDCP